VKNFRDLKVWQKAHQLVLAIYPASKDFPREEVYGETSQMRRSAVSVAANLAEGCGRGSDRALAHYVSIASGSASELEYHLLLCHDLGWLPAKIHADLEARTIEVKRMLTGLRSKLTDDGAANR